MVRTAVVPCFRYISITVFLLGKLVYANAAGIPLVFLNDFQANEDLINTRGDMYNDRPKMVMLNELCDGKYIVSPHALRSPPYSFHLVGIHRQG